MAQARNVFLPLLLVLLSGFLRVSTASAASPSVGTVTPASGKSAPDQSVSIIAASSDPDGWSNLTDVRLLVNTSTAMVNAVCVRYDRSANKLYLLDDAGTTWLGGVAPGSATTLENSWGRLYCAQTIIAGSGTTLTVTWQISFKSAFAGKTYNTDLWAQDDTTSVGWIQRGTWVVDGTPPTTPVVADDGQYTASRTQLHATWGSSDPEAGVVEYQYQITRDSAAGAVMVPWTSTGTSAQVTRTGLSLIQGVKYFFSVKARNGVNLWSAIGASDGIFVDVNVPLIGTITPPDGTTYTDGDSVRITVAASDADGDLLQYQFLADGVVKQAWSSTASWTWNTAGVIREHQITIQVRDPYTRQVGKNFKLFGYRKPRGTP